MAESTNPQMPSALSIAHGIPLSEEPGLGALTIAAYLQEVAVRFSDRESMVMHMPKGVERWTYNKLREQSFDVAKALIAAGVGKDSRIGILMANRLEYLSAVFGIGLAGGVSVPLSTFSTPSELEYLLQVSGVSVLLFDGRVLKKNFVAMLSELDPAVQKTQGSEFASTKFPFLRRLVVLDSVTEVDAATRSGAIETWDDFLAAGKAITSAVVEARGASVKPADAGALFFSSGTTSLPKGILHAQRAICIQWWRWPRLMCVEGPVRTWTGNGFFWSANFTMVVGVALSTGGAIVLQPTFQPDKALELMEVERVHLPNGRPHQWARLQAAPNWSTANLSSLRYADKRMALAQHPTVKCDWQWPPSYGTTETLTINTSFSNATPREVMGKSYGQPLPGNTLKIVDPMTGVIVPLGQRGEIAIKGPTLMSGYVGKPSEECFDAEGFFRTGDGGYIDEMGRLFWEGRLTEIIKSGGANVSPPEVDTVVATYPGVRITQTVGVPHDTLGEMVVTCIIPQNGVTLEEEALRAFLKEKLASFKVPRRVLFFSEDEVAVTGNGKVKSGELKELAAKRLGLVQNVPSSEE